MSALGRVRCLLAEYVAAGKGSDGKEKERIERTMRYALIFVTAFSWLLFPILLKFLAPSFFRFSFALVFAVVFLLYWRYQNINRVEFSKEQKLFFYLWGGYLLALMVATVHANVFYSYQQLLIVFLKVFFFFFLLLFIERTYINKTFSIYANLMVIIVIMALAVAIGVAMGIFEQIATLRFVNHIGIDPPKGLQWADYYPMDLYWGAYYGRSQLHAPFPLFRLQGFAEEYGTFAFSLLPALFWMWIVKKAKFRSLILALGLLASCSFGAVLALLIMMPLFLKGRSMRSIKIVFSAILLSLFVLAYVIFIQTGIHFEWIYNALFAGKEASFLDRTQGVAAALSYLGSHPIGTGVGLGMITVHYAIAVGFANAALESGVVGGISYLLMFSLLACLAVKMVWTSDGASSENKMRIAIGLSVLALIIMGAQRQQPDISLWHMWIYASFFYLVMKENKTRIQIPSATL